MAAGENLVETVSIFAASETLSLRHDRFYHGGTRDSITAERETLLRRQERLYTEVGETLSRRQQKLYHGGTSDSITAVRKTITAALETLSRRQDRFDHCRRDRVSHAAVIEILDETICIFAASGRRWR